ncbi:MAG: CocE/NonD family hydrolase [Gemmatimonadetes bacterium]|nr:CocE/NonD family hydrolase [Gemmatimonadota bacterium]NIR76878.1 CocE/NonD family hydrolase [Gemmatimonadota bacterium]NIT85406.1 CocE/NonD family hydrolase [Gemmatimonadota bacterium]NIU29220.1 CocE/NonD family hydrolase [Gemmatimonadota bacterium]NIU34313.1 CocE/NonD family hydrolase [Gemmatimonadota bacterium]
MRGLGATTLAVVATALAPGAARAQSEPPYEAILFREGVRVETRDGTGLATDVFRPARGGRAVEGPFPALLQRTPYGRTRESLRDQALWFARHGYVVVVQDMRGRYDSEGVFEKYHRWDAPDGHDSVEWIAALPYVEGEVGMWGTSYGAHTQADAAKTDPPHLGALLLNMGGLADGWTYKVRNHGAFELGQQLGWAFSEAPAGSEDPAVRARFQAEEVADWFAAVPLRKGLSPLSLVPNFEAYYLEMQNHGDYDERWKAVGVNWQEYYEETADVPMVHVGGWYDTYGGSTVQNYEALSRLKSSAQHLIMGPWTHGGNARSVAGDVEFGPSAAIPDFQRDFQIRWFDRHLKGEAAGEPLPPVRLFVMGGGDGRRTPEGRVFHGGYWRDARAWPLPEAEATPYYLHPDGGLRTEPPVAQEASTTYRYDPEHPVPTIGGSFSGALKRGAYHQREAEFVSREGRSENGFYGSRPPYLPLASRQDVLVFQTPPLDRDVEVIGPVTVKLWVSSSAVDTDFTAKLVDVYPPSPEHPEGFHMNITDGILRARYRSSPQRPELMTPGEVYEITIEPFPTANVFQRGHRIRIDISSSNFPRFDVNPNTGEPLGRHRWTVPAENTVHHGARRPSHVVLPVVPLGG